MFSSHIFRANDIRGVYNKDFDLSFTKDLSLALFQLSFQKGASPPQFLVGHDARLSSPEISQALTKNLVAQGAQVAFIGLAPSPLCYFLLNHYNLTACVVVTASHNPPEDNGFKILFHHNYKIPYPIKRIKNLLLNKKSVRQKALKRSGTYLNLEKEKAYIEWIKKEFSAKKFPPFVIDTGSGALGPLAKKVFSALQLNPKILFDQPDGRFPYHHPDPTLEENLSQLKKEIKKGSFELGIGFDGDGDRLSVMDKAGRLLFGDELGYLFLKSLDKKRGALILADVKCSDWFFNLAKKEGFKILMIPSGHARIRAEMERTQAQLAIEFSGHIFFNDRKGSQGESDDALYASLRLLELLSLKNQPLKALMPQTVGVGTREIRINMSWAEAKKKLSQIQSYLQQRGESFVAIDGVRLSRSSSYALFRVSKTQPLLSMRFSASDQKKLKQIKSEFSRVINEPIP